MMSSGSEGRRTQQLLLMATKRVQDRETSPELGPKTWVQKQQGHRISDTKVAVIYYLSHNGQLEHPHFMEVSLSSSHGLRLKDVLKRLDLLRGQGMSAMYAWSAKRSYKNGYVWQDLSEEDILQPSSQGNEYVLKGSKLVDPSQSFRSYDTVSSFPSSSSSSSSSNPSTTRNSTSESCRCSSDSNFPAGMKTQTRVSFEEIREQNRVYRVETDEEFLQKAENAATQTEDEGERRERREERESGSADITDQRAENDRPSGRMVVSTVLMQLVSCGSKKAQTFKASDQ